ncbi:mitochondrial 37S ribosomal protein rsm10 [Ptychographa xylographoides]|nr:mitochondrial 37S ribosomal protein rsm10 [Ptychographa xylographoides]
MAKRLKLDPARTDLPQLPFRFILPLSHGRAANFTTRAQYRRDGQVMSIVPPASHSETTQVTDTDTSTELSKNDENSMYDEDSVHDEDIEAIRSGMDDDNPVRRLPRSVQAVYLRPLKRQAQYGVPACDLQLRSYSVRNVEFFADFALRAAYYLNLPAAGPIPLPRITERWTVPRSNFIFKKSQENFERITLRRLIQVQDGHPETIEIWLAFLRKHAYHGVGMKANIWSYESLGIGKTMDVSLENLKQVMEPKWAHFGRKKNLDTSEKVMEMLNSDRYRKVDDGPFNNL